jgi:L-fucose mutarotase
MPVIRGPLTHPGILATLASAGHGSKILISDFNYPHATCRGPHATIVYANFAPGHVRAADLLACIAASVPIEAAAVMRPLDIGPYAMEGEPPVWESYRKTLLEHAGFDQDLEQIERHAFYAAASDDRHALTIATGETSLYANLLLTIGVIQPGG